MPEEASRVHGFTRADLEGKPKFAEVVDAFLAFVGDDALIAHNARFDFGFLNAELQRVGRKPLDMGRMVDTLDMARERFPGMPNSLDALCRRFGVDLSARTTHNALLDCKLLAEVYVELMGGRQHGLGLVADGEQAPAVVYDAPVERRVVKVYPTAAELAVHATFVEKLKDPVWNT